jgi:hypothetical protein
MTVIWVRDENGSTNVENILIARTRRLADGADADKHTHLTVDRPGCR